MTAKKRNRLLFSLLYETGIRVGEALGILVPHVHLNDVDGGYIRIIGKGDHERIVPLIDAPRTVRLLRETLKSFSVVGPLFRGDPRKGGSAGEALDYTTLYYHFERYLEIAQKKKLVQFPTLVFSGGPMKRLWSDDDLVAHFTLLPQDRDQLSSAGAV